MPSADPRLVREDLINYFHSSIVPPERNRIGVEYELLCLERGTHRRLAYSGTPGIAWLLERLLKESGGERVEEEGRLIGIHHPEFNISIEPGGQLEASFPPCKTIKELAYLLNSYLARLQAAGGDQVHWIAVGVDPFTPFAEVPWVPKQRYEIMRRYWAQHPGLSLHMMGQTAAVQLSLDYNSESDAVAKLRNAVALAQILAGLVANSPVYEGALRYTGSFRQRIWCRTDRERSGVPAGCGQAINSFSDYVDYALALPLLFLRQSGGVAPLDRRFTFAEFLETGWGGRYPDLEDWRLHLNTVFSLVRFNRTVLELRVFDSNSPQLVLALAALVRGVFYSGQSFSPLTQPSELLAVARQQLRPEEERYLEPLELLVTSGLSPAESAAATFRAGGRAALLDRLRIG